MTEKEKARDLVDKFLEYVDIDVRDSRHEVEGAKQCAIICADEIMDTDWFIPSIDDLNRWNHYWNNVKLEIKNI